MTQKDIYKSVMRDYEKTRDIQARQLENRKNEVYEKIPRISEIDSRLSLLGIEIAKSILQSPEEKESFIGRLQKTSEALLEEKEALLYQNGYSPKYLQPEYRCTECQDTGFIGARKCACFVKRFIHAAYDYANLSEKIQTENFEHFDFRFYSNNPDPEEGISPRENMERIYETCIHFVKMVRQKGTGDNLLLYGMSGLGKTFLCHSIAKELLDAGKTVLYLTSFQLCKMIEKERFGNQNADEDRQEFPEYLDMVFSVDLLILDDLGTEFSTILTSSELYHIINSRIMAGKPTVISTNLAPGDLIHQYSDRIVSRIQGHYLLLKFFGEDIRLQKKYKPLHK